MLLEEEEGKQNVMICQSLSYSTKKFSHIQKKKVVEVSVFIACSRLDFN